MIEATADYGRLAILPFAGLWVNEFFYLLAYRALGRGKNIHLARLWIYTRVFLCYASERAAEAPENNSDRFLCALHG